MYTYVYKLRGGHCNRIRGESFILLHKSYNMKAIIQHLYGNTRQKILILKHS